MSTIPFRGYERVYEVGLLDDLHNFFPALLYQPTRFDSVRDVLEYVIQQTQDHFNLFNRGFRNYRADFQPGVRRTAGGGTTVDVAVNETVQITPIMTRAVGTAPRAAPAADTTTTAAPMNTAPPTAAPPPTFNVEFGMFDQDDPAMLQGIQGLLNLIGGGGIGGIGGLGGLGVNGLLNVGGAGGIIPQNLTPVIVAPTTDQIATATDLRMATTADETINCSVCQESVADGQAIRRINHCGHTFHRNCIDTWFRTSVRCPVCRHDIRETAGPRVNIEDAE
jgi:hypothetical protein